METSVDKVEKFNQKHFLCSKGRISNMETLLQSMEPLEL